MDRLIHVDHFRGMAEVLARRRRAPRRRGAVRRLPLRPGRPGLPRAVPAPRPAVTLDDAATIVFTSGSTGEPKGVVLRHVTMLSTALVGQERFGIGPGDRVSPILPQAFAAGQELVVMALLNGATLCVQDPRSMGRRELVD